ncbi:predicted protein, partial [Nematostella vectensis]
LPVGPPDADGPYHHAAVATDSGKCSEIGRDMMKLRNGSAVDATIAALFCVGVMNMHSAGIGGGGFIVVYNRSTKFSEVFDFRGKAPGLANKTMYINSHLSSRIGPSAVAVPGEIKGYLAAWRKYGRLPWKVLIQPSIDLAREGVQIGYDTFSSMKDVQPVLINSRGLRELLISEDGKLRKLGETIKLPKLARTLEQIRDDPESFYTGDLARDIVNELQEEGGLITLEDMRNYKVKVRKPLKFPFGEYNVFTTPPPGSGTVLNLILNILKGFKMTGEDRKDDASSILTYHRIVEAFKFAYANRALLGDPEYSDIYQAISTLTDPAFAEGLRKRISDTQTYKNLTYYGKYFVDKDYEGTTHVSVLAPNGDAVAATTTISFHFGSKFMGRTTGILYNNQMAAFAVAEHPNKTYEREASNFISPGKRPSSTSAPSVIVNKMGDVTLVVGASGGTKINTAVSQAIMNFFWFNRTLSQSVMDPRVHHQLLPMYIRVEKDYPMPQAILDGLKRLGHEVVPKEGFAVVQAVTKGEDGRVMAKSDPRKFGWAAGF